MDPTKPIELPERPKKATLAGLAPTGEPLSKAAAKKAAKKAANKSAKKAAKKAAKQQAQTPKWLLERSLQRATPLRNCHQDPHPLPVQHHGVLHIGHSKAIAVNFGFAKYHGGECILRFDDTNPEGEDERYYDSIRDIVSWLGIKPVRETNASDNFDPLSELPEELIKRDGAYVCHCTEAEVKVQRGQIGPNQHGGQRFGCAHRTRPIEESIREFRAMRDGNYEAGEAALRLKQDYKDPNPQMWDLFIGLLKVPHPITAIPFEKDSNGIITCVHAKCEKLVRPKTFVHWVAESPKHGSPIRAEIRAFEGLLKSDNPKAHPDGFLADINPASKQIFPDAMIETGYHEISRSAPWPKKETEASNLEANKHSIRFQGTRIAYFAVDRDSTANKIVLNRIVTLKDTQGKN